MNRYWIAVACQSHVKRGIHEGICQVCHGKGGPLKQMLKGDYLIYYSPTIEFGNKEPHRCFTAIGRIQEKPAYQYQMSADFIPWRRDVAYVKSMEAKIEPLIEQLSFIKDKVKWGYPFKRGCFTISPQDFFLIARAMEADIETELFGD